MWSSPPLSKADVLIKEAKDYVAKATDTLDRLHYATLINNGEERKTEMDKLKIMLKDIQTWGDKLTEKVNAYVKEEKTIGNVRNFTLNKMYLETKK